MLRSALGKRRRIASMRDAANAGNWAEAIVLSADVGLGTFQSRSPGQATFRANRVRLSLNVRTSEGASYQVTQSAYFGEAELAGLQPGARLRVRIHPTNPQEVFVPYRPATTSSPPPGGTPLGLVS